MPSSELLQATSTTLSIVSTVSWVLAQLPQQIQNYKNKKTDGISVQFLMLWFFGDFTSFLGCYLTNQLPFQMYLSCYFLFNDIVLISQYFHYLNYYDSHPRHSLSLAPSTPTINIGIKHKLSRLSTILVSTLSNMSGTAAVPISNSDTTQQLISPTANTYQIGVFIAWCCTFIYLSSRLPQLYKNYVRKSVDGISPLLFMFALVGNLTYSISIVCSMFAIDNSAGERAAFMKVELPYILGSAGTVLFDGGYFYQRWLYGVHETHKYIVVNDGLD
ncbi:hypothetical protein CANARDRAFT_29279 [[Candida] arabinofermentans NRRL YB-2248]|uniref:Uncharacterized protein n=1 Tax=[Candida] arabinofermentans NRRL YB-2248 TaxID=983967 RepID=A0A1E4SY47_9ASCO|nr:hypothetical protein CANARDRAFT_29279 [[Candida] arabinofermentans NRRL YB-2248]